MGQGPIAPGRASLGLVNLIKIWIFLIGKIIQIKEFF
jgi:hypothetical protein